jgi:hypothetical protein
MLPTKVMRHYEWMLECVGDNVSPNAVKKGIHGMLDRVKFLKLPWPSFHQRLELLLMNESGSRQTSSMDSSCTKWMKLPSCSAFWKTCNRWRLMATAITSWARVLAAVRRLNSWRFMCHKLNSVIFSSKGSQEATSSLWKGNVHSREYSSPDHCPYSRVGGQDAHGGLWVRGCVSNILSSIQVLWRSGRSKSTQVLEVSSHGQYAACFDD